MKDTTSLKNQFLIAMPKLKDSNFHQAVIYIYEHTPKGAMGVVINKPMQLTLGDVLRHLKIEVTDPTLDKRQVLHGGPVAQEQGFIMHCNKELQDKKQNTESGITITASRDVLEAVANGKGPDNILMTLGYSGWSAGQLEREMSDNSNSWIIAPANMKILFDTPFTDRWRAAAALVGVDFNRLSNDVGHA